MSGPRRAGPPAPDPVYRGLPADDGTLRYQAIEGYSREITDLALQALVRSAWHRHRIGRAVYAHCVNGSRWIIGLSIGDDVPPWWDRLQVKRGR